MSIPAHLFYSADHEWLRAEGAEAIIGITAFAAQELGDIVYLDMSRIGVPFKKRDIFGTVEAVKTVSDLFMPVSGVIVEVNPKVIQTPGLINDDPYGEGWLVRIVVERPADLGDLLDADDYGQLIGHV